MKQTLKTKAALLVILLSFLLLPLSSCESESVFTEPKTETSSLPTEWNTSFLPTNGSSAISERSNLSQASRERTRPRCIWGKTIKRECSVSRALRTTTF